MSTADEDGIAGVEVDAGEIAAGFFDHEFELPGLEVLVDLDGGADAEVLELGADGFEEPDHGFEVLHGGARGHGGALGEADHADDFRAHGGGAAGVEEDVVHGRLEEFGLHGEDAAAAGFEGEAELFAPAFDPGPMGGVLGARVEGVLEEEDVHFLRGGVVEQLAVVPAEGAEAVGVEPDGRRVSHATGQCSRGRAEARGGGGSPAAGDYSEREAARRRTTSQWKRTNSWRDFSRMRSWSEWAPKPRGPSSSSIMGPMP